MLFPHSNDCNRYYRKTRFTSKIIYYKHVALNRIPFKKVEESDNIIRVAKKPFLNEYEYLKFIRRNLLPVNRFHCPTNREIVDLLYCFSMCRFSPKFNCKIYMRRLWGCLACNKSFYKVCDKIKTCKKRKRDSAIIQFYFSQELAYNYDVWKRLRWGYGYRKNYYGHGPSIYYNTGRRHFREYVNIFYRKRRRWGKRRKCR